MTVSFYILYGLLILAISASPGTEAFYSGDGVRRSRARDSAAFPFALASAYALPWGGVPLIPSAAWFPAFSIALLLLSARDERRGVLPAWGRKAAAILCAGLFYGGMSWFMLRIGTPGALFSIEGMSAAFRLESLGNRFLLLPGAFFVGLLLSFSGVGLRGGLSASLFFFSCAGFLTNTFLLPMLSRVLLAAGAEPPRSLVLQIVSAFLIAAVLGKILRLPQGRSILPGAARRVSACASVCFVLAGCAALAAFR